MKSYGTEKKTSDEKKNGEHSQKLPDGIKTAIIGGIIVMLVGILIMNMFSFAKPAPEMPRGDTASDEYKSYMEDYDEWKMDKANSDRLKPMFYKVGMFVYDLGVILLVIGLFTGAFTAKNIDKHLRMAMVLGGALILGLIFGNQSSYMNLWFI